MDDTDGSKSARQAAERPDLSAAKAALLARWMKGKGGPAPAGEAILRGPPGPLSFAQRRLWFLHQLDPSSPAYNMYVAHRLRGPLDEAALDRALAEIVRRHEVLRTTFEAGPDGAPRQVVRPAPATLLRAHDVASEDALRARLDEESRAPVDLARGPILRANLYRLGAQERVLLVTVHHVAFDEWSEAVFTRELSALYAAYARGLPSPLAEPPIQYADYARWQSERAHGPALERQLAFWRARLDGLAPLELPTDRPRPPQLSFRGRMLPFRLDAATSDALRALCRAAGVTPFMALLAAFQVLLHRHSGQDDVAVGSPTSGRERPESQGLLGFFVNTLVLRADLSGEPTFLDLLARVKAANLEAYGNADLPFERLVEELHPRRDPSRAPLVQAFYAHQNAVTERLTLPGVQVEPAWVFSPTSKWDVSLFTLDDPDGIRCWLEHSTDLWDEATGEPMARRFQTLVAALARDPAQRIGDLPLLPDDERALLDAWNRTAADLPNACVHRLVAEQARRTPDRIAVECAGERVTYAELDARADRIARRLRARGAAPGTLVALLAERSIDMVAGALGVLRSGAAYVPLDPSYPKERVAYMLRDSGARLLLAHPGLAADLPPHDAEVVPLEGEDAADAPDAEPDGGATAEDLAYVIYTSGSTGRPKGTQIPHRALANFLWDMRARLALREDDAWLSVTTLSFDIAALELYLPLLVGARVEVATGDAVRDPALLLDRLRGATVMQATPATWRMLLDAGWGAAPRLRKALSGGEALAPAVARELLARADEAWNLYGPTETTVWSTAHRLVPGEARVPIGRPLANTRVHVVDARMTRVPLGVPGELLIGGDGLARGYHGRPDLTAERFVLWNGERVYRTGDRARWLADGTLEHLGRLDRQVKVRGHRIELGEVEAALLEDVREAAVVVHKDALVAYVAPREDAPAADLATAIVNDWRPVFDARAEEAAPDPTFDTGVWTSSHTGRPFPREEMEEWVATTAARVLSFRPRRVLEIGCGTGLILWRVAPACEAYVGTDFSAATLARLRNGLDARGVQNVRLLEREATDLTGVDGEFDLVLLNSVAQYFPDAEYLARVLEQAAARVRPGGVVLVGDVRSLPLQRAFHASVERARAGRDVPPEELARLVDKRVDAEAELLLHPAFFDALRRRVPALRRVRILPRAGRHRNEMSCYRYDAVLHVGTAPEAVEVRAWTAWPGVDALAATLRDARPDALGFLGVPNARVDARADAVEPDDLVELARSLGYAVELSWAAGREDGSFDVALARGEGPVVAQLPDAPPPAALASEPLRTRARREQRRALVPLLRARLAERLPEPMVPGTFVVLDALPLTPNGKVDRRALPPPDGERPDALEAFVPPRTPAEAKVAQAFAQLLGLDRVGARDDFFALGGHSLLAAQLVARLRDALGVEVPLRAVFSHPTVEGLAALDAAPARAPVLPLSDRLDPPLSSAQERLWFLHQLDPLGAAYNMATALRLRGPLDEDALRRALDGVAARHEALRTTVALREGAPVQRVHPPRAVPLDVVEARDEAEATRLAQDAAHAPFDLLRGPLFRATLVRLAPEDHLLVLGAHHLVFDEWSERVALHDLAALYAGEPLPPVALQQADVAAWQRAQDVDAHLAYWRARLADARPAEVPADRPRPPVQTFRGRGVTFRVPAAGLRALARTTGATLFMTLAAACQALLRRHGGSDDVVLGSPVAAREAPGSDGVVGFFVNTVALRTDLSGDPTVRDLLARVKETCVGAFAHQEAPFERVVGELGVPRDLRRTPLFQAALVLQPPPEETRLAGLRVERRAVESRVAKFDLTFWAADEGDHLAITVERNADLFEEETAERLARDLGALLRGMADAPDAPLSALPLPEDGTRAWSGRASEYPRDRRVDELFEDAARRFPDRVALDGDRALTYAELDREADALAARLQARGVGPESMVGVCLERSADAVVALLAVLKAGGAYVPLDPAHPDERLAFVLADTRAQVVVTRAALAPRVSALHPDVLLVDAREPAAAAPRRAPETTADALAYVMYTSGSTGRPKGVMVPHRAIVRLVTAQDYVRFGPDETFLQYAPLAFDAATFEVWGALLHGARLVVAPPRSLAPHELARLLHEKGVTTLWLTAPLFHLMVDEDVEGLRGLRQLVAGGDALSPPHVRRALDALPGLRLVNGYGPTECTTFACCHVVTEAPGERVPIGRPLANTRALVLDPQMRPVPVGAPGELYLGGDGLARGYLNLPAATRERFVQRDGERLYRTGDRARWRSDGALDFLGRLDEQVKVRGHRVEPGEVEAALAAHPKVAEAAVVARADASGERRLVAYVVPRAGGDVDADALREHVRRRLPEAFVPSAVVALDALPLTQNGKVDRRALPEPPSEDEAAHAPPEGPVEEILAGLFAQTLGVARVGALDDFFVRGGDSLLATRLVSRVRAAFGVDLPLPDVFAARTLRGLARVVRERIGHAPALPPLEPSREAGDAPLSFGQERLWFLHQLDPSSAAYNNPGAFRLRGPLDVPALEAALDGVLRRHDVLRTVYLAVGGAPAQRVLPHEPYRLDVVDVRDDAEARRLADEHAARPFDLAKGPVCWFRLLRRAPDDHVLLASFHHVAFDGWSVGVLFREVGEQYAARREGREPRLPDLRVQYADHARWQRRALADLAPQVDAWRRRLAGLRPLDLPTDRPRPPTPSMRGRRAALLVPPRLVKALAALAQREGATLFMTLLAAWSALLHRHAGQDDVAVGSPVAGRRVADVDPLIGFFVNTLVLRTDLSDDPTFREAIARVRRTCLDAYADQDVPFDRLVDALQPQRDPSRAPLVQILFALQERVAPPLAEAGLRAEELPCETGAAKLDLALSLAPEGDALRGELEYATDLFDHATVERLGERFLTLLEGVAEDPDLPLSHLPLASEAEAARILREAAPTVAEFPRDRLVHELFEAHVDRAPQAVALEAGTERVTYAELDARANRIARRLQDEGAGPETLVGVLLEPSVDAFAAVLGVLKAGAAYVPLDPASPRDRIAGMLEDARARIVVTRSGMDAALPPGVERVVRTDDADLARFPATRPASGAASENLAYVIYTSGSTGRPKGVLVEHLSVVHFVTQFQRIAQAGPDARLLQSASLSFDASVAEMALSLFDGGTMVLPPRPALSGEELRRLLAERRITTYATTPALLRSVEPGRLPHLRLVVSGGEACPPEVVAAWSRGRRFLNGYGPTEATVGVTVAECPPGVRASPPIGRPLPNVRALVLDGRMRPVPPGLPGQLHLGGVALARGYLRRPELTVERFVRDPFLAEKGARLYRTGDVCRVRSDGQLEFLGRMDGQLKVRGFRIEPGEVESLLRERPGVRDAVVAAREDRLVAYVVADEVDATALRAFLRARVPPHMVPAAFVRLDALPLTPSGKVDRRALPEPGAADAFAQAPFVEPEGATQQALARAWSDLLGAPRVGAQDGFFELGGHSLLVTRLVARVRDDLGVDLPMSAVFESPTLADLAARVDALQGAGASAPIPRIDRSRGASGEGPR